MLDLLYVVITIAFFLLARAYVAGCERLESQGSLKACTTGRQA